MLWASRCWEPQRADSADRERICGHKARGLNTLRAYYALLRGTVRRAGVAIYARKSTDQIGVADDQKSVTRQIEHAKKYAAAKGWTVDEASIFVDDGISGAEFANRPGFLRLMNALKPRPPFQVLIMSEESRLGREAIETAYALKQLVTAGVRVFFPLEDRERTLDSPTDKIMMSLTAFADELEREKARQRTYDAMARKARAGHVTGGRVFGYDNIDVVGPGGKRSHVERRINEAEAAIVRKIFRLSAAGVGQVRIAKTICDGETFGPGCHALLGWKPHGDSGPSWKIKAEVLPNAVWRRGRLFLPMPSVFPASH